MRPFFAMIDVNYWQNPKVLEAGFRGGVVFQQLLIVNGANRCEGHIPPRFSSPAYLARVTGAVFASREFPGDPVDWFAAGLDDAERAELIVRDLTGIIIPGFATEWGAKSDSTERMRRFRERHRIGVTSVTRDVTPSPVRHSGHVTSRDGRSDHSKSDEMDRRSSPTRSDQDPPDATTTQPVSTRPAADLTPGRATEPVAASELPLTPTDSTEATNQAPAKRQRARHEIPIEALTAANLLIDRIVARSPGSKLGKASPASREATAQRWGDTIRLMRDRDEIPYPTVMAMIDWAHNDAFWSTVILSADNLREKWDTLALQRDRARGIRRGPIGAVPPPPATAHDDGEGVI